MTVDEQRARARRWIIYGAGVYAGVGALTLSVMAVFAPDNVTRALEAFESVLPLVTLVFGWWFRDQVGS